MSEYWYHRNRNAENASTSAGTGGGPGTTSTGAGGSSSSNNANNTWMNRALLRELTEADAFHSNLEDLVDLDMLDNQTNIQLRLHQYTLLKHCLSLEKTRRVQLAGGKYFDTKAGIIGDKVGSGKSYVILAMLLHPIQHDTSSIRNVTTLGQGMVTLFEAEAPETTFNQTNLLIIPHNLSSQWFEYTQRFFKSSAPAPAAPTAPATNNNQQDTAPAPAQQTGPKVLLVNRNKIIDEIESRRINLDSYKLVIVTNTMYNRLVHVTTTRNFKWQRAIFDEIDNTHFPSCPEVYAEFYWFVTASFGNLIYPYGLRQWSAHREQHTFRASGLSHSGFVKNIFVGIKDHKAVSYGMVLKNEDTFVDRASNLPEPQVRNIICRTPVSIRVLQGLVSRAILDSLNAGDVESAIRNTRVNQRHSEDSIITILLAKWQNQLDTGTSQDMSAEKRAKLLEKMETVKQRIRDAETCCICMDTVENKTVAQCCSNAYCFKCIHVWLARSPICPLCKAPTAATDLLIVDNNAPTALSHVTEQLPAMPPPPPVCPETNTSVGNDKAENLRALLTVRLQDPNAKILIFSSYDRSFVNLNVMLAQMGIVPTYLKGNSYCIRNILNRYKSGEQRVLFVNVDHYGSGLNLEMTTDVIMFHRFDSEIEKQIIGRAQRPGRWCSLKVWYLLHNNELPPAEAASASASASASAPAAVQYIRPAARSGEAGPSSQQVVQAVQA